MDYTARHVLVIAAALATSAALMAIMPAAAQPANMIGTVRTAALVPVARRSGTFLDLWVRAYTPPRRGAVEAVVALRAGGFGKEIEVGRFAVFPSEPFFATVASQQRAYRFDATAALNAVEGDQLFAVVKLEPFDPAIPADDAQLTIARAELSPRPPN